MRRGSRPFAAAALFAVAITAGCAGSGVTTGTLPGAAAPPPPSRSAHPADAAFITGMIHHHAQALVMAGLAGTHAGSPAIRTLAERIHVGQTDEIRLMQLWLTDMSEPVPEPSPTGMRMVTDGMAHDVLMPGMLSEEQVDELERAHGADFDRLFLTFMIQHHEGALDMVDALFATDGAAIDDAIYKIASDTFADQGSEIDRMQRILDALASAR